MKRRLPLAVGWLLALLLVALFCRLGVWQLDRARQKQAMLDSAQRVLAERVALPLSAAGDARHASDYQWAAGRGEFVDADALLLDNQTAQGASGVRAYRLFQPQGGGAPLLVDLGWIALPGDRRMPEVARPGGTVELRGLLAPPPSPGLALGPAALRDGGHWLLTRLDPAALPGEIGLRGALAPRVLRLDPALSLGYARDLDILPNTLPPARHLAYAVQWFGMALALLAIALGLTLRRRRAAHAKMRA